MAGEYIFTMRDLRKVVPPSREILKGIYLSFFPGAKIGVLGANGAGKSSLLRIMAGVDKDFLGDARPLPGTRIGYLPQEPQLDASKDVRGNVEEAVAESRAHPQAVRGAQRRVRGADGRRRDDQAAGEAGQPAGADRRARSLGARPQGGHGDGRAPPAAGRRRRDQAVRRRAPPRRALPGPAGPARHAAARRADQPSRRRERLVARAVPRRVPGDRRRRHPRPLLPRQRGGLDPRALSGRGHPLGGELFLLAGAEGAAARHRREAGVGSAEDPAAGAGVDPDVAPRAAGEEQGTHRALRGASRRGGSADGGHDRDPDSRPRAAGRRGRRRRST